MSLHQFSASRLHKAFLSGELSAMEIASFFIDRTQSLNQALNGYLETYADDVKKWAIDLDNKRKAGESLPPLAAVPVALKDNMHIRGKKTTAGSKILSSYKAIFDATVTEKLLASGALIMGKTNLDEFAMGSSTEHSAFGPTKNPWDLKKTPGGSSGGSAAVVAAGLAPLSLGSDTGGSIRQPASFCGIVGFKPTYGAVSRYGLIAFASSLDQIGPFARSVEDAALIFDLIKGHDPRDATSIKQPIPSPRLDKNALKGCKIGVDRRLLEGLDCEVAHIFEETIGEAKRAGAHIVDIEMKLHKHALSVYYILAPAEASSNLARYDGVGFSQRCDLPTDLADLYDRSRNEGFGAEVKRRILMGSFVLSAGYSSAYYQKAQLVRSKIISEFEEIFQKVDTILLPTSPTGAFDLGSILSPLAMYMNDIFTIPVNLAGLPAISIPRGATSQGLPIGMQLIAPQKRDNALLEWAFALEHPEWVDRVSPIREGGLHA